MNIDRRLAVIDDDDIQSRRLQANACSGIVSRVELNTVLLLEISDAIAMSGILRWVVNALAARQSIKAKAVGAGRRKRSRLRLVIPTLKPKYCRAARVPPKRMILALRLRRR